MASFRSHSMTLPPSLSSVSAPEMRKQTFWACRGENLKGMRFLSRWKSSGPLHGSQYSRDPRQVRKPSNLLSPRQLIYYLTLSRKSSRLKRVRKGSRVLGEASRKAGKWPLQARMRVFATPLGGKKGEGWPIDTRTRLLLLPSGSLEGFRVYATGVPFAS
jgi:hypothetical protein